jgi:Mg/Co/Ni transporter MgtE
VNRPENSPLTLAFLDREPHTAARALEAVDAEDAAAFLNRAPARIVAPAVCVMIPWAAARCVERMSAEQASGLLRAMNHADAVSILRLVGVERREELLKLATRRFARSFRNALVYPKEAIGAWMDVTHAPFQDTTLVRNAARTVRRMKRAQPYFFLTDPQKRYSGAVFTTELFCRDENAALSDIADVSVRPLSNRETVQACRSRPEWDRMTMLPVVGRKQNFLGALDRSSLKKALLDQETLIRIATPGSVLMQLASAYMTVGAAFANLTLLENETSSPVSPKEKASGRKRKSRS